MWLMFTLELLIRELYPKFTLGKGNRYIFN